MRRLRSWLKLAAIPGTLGGALLCGPSLADGPSPLPPLPQATALPPLPPLPPSPSPDGTIVQVQAPAVTPAQPGGAPATTTGAATGVTGGSGDLFGSVGGGGGGTSAAAATGGTATAGGQPAAAAPSAAQSSAAASSPAASTVSGVESQTRASTDLGDLLGKSQASLGVEVQHRNPIITDPRVRGYHVGELFTIADGAYFFPARQDLDTIVSKIDSSLIRDVVVVKGPYSVRYGPGFAFLDVETLGSPRYKDGFEAHGTTSLLFKTNGDQWHGRQSVWGGDADWGFRVGYDLMEGSDYRVGGPGFKLPSGYSSQNVDAAFGFDLTPDSSIEVRTLHQDMHDVDLPGQAFDIRHSYTDSATVRYTLRHQDYFETLTADAWYNQTRFDGDNLAPSKQIQLFSLNPAEAFTGITDGNVQSVGYRVAVSWGQEKHAQLTVGTDLEYLTQRLTEFDTTFGQSFTFPIPRSHLLDPGVFMDGVLPLFEDRLVLKAGVRADWASTAIDSLTPQELTGTQDAAGNVVQAGYGDPIANPTIGAGPYDRRFDLWAAYLSAEYKATDHWSLLSGFGMALNPPTLTELYAENPLLAVVQNGLNIVAGNTRLNPEQVRQFDLGLRANYETFRFGVNGFYAWIHDYITFEETAPPTPPFSANSIAFVNTNRATLSGFELYADWDLFEWLTPFATAEYVEGRDYTRDSRGTVTPLGQPIPTPLPGSFSPQEPLPGIPPLEGRVGFRLHDAGKNPRWGVEAVARMVSGQHRIAESLGEQATPGFTIFNVRGFWKVNKAVLLTAGVENLGNRLYREALDLRTGLGVFQPGVDFYFGAQVSY